MKKVFGIVLVIAMIFCFVACGVKSVVGKWAFGGNSFEFRKDNTVSISVNGALNYDGTYVIEDDKIVITTKGLLGEVTKEFKYNLKGDILTLTGDITFMSGVDMTLELEKQK